MFPKWSGRLAMLSKPYQVMTVSLADIARFTAWTWDFVNDTGTTFLVNLYLESGQDGFQFTEGQDWFAWSVQFVKGSNILLRNFASVLEKDHMFSNFIRLRFRFADFAWYIQLLDRSSDQWLVKVGWILVVMQNFYGSL